MDNSLDQTITALDGGLTSLSPQAATSNIDGWIQTLSGNESLAGIAGGLRELKTALTSSPLDGGKIGQLLTSLGSQTTSAAATADPESSAKVARLGGMLEKAGTALSR